MKRFLLLPILAAVVYIANAQTNPSGTCGDNLTWELNLGTGELVISGYGEMANYQNSYSTPWHANSSQVLSLSLPSGMTTIGKYAFANLSELTTVTLPNSVKKIEYGAFYNCEKMETLNLGKVEEIGYYVFEYCDALAELTLPSTLTTIGYRAFYYSGIKNITIPNTVTSLDLNVFEHSKLETLVLNSTITKVPGELCLCCASLKSVTIPEGVTTIGDASFYYCTSLQTITLPSTMSVIDASFEGCSGLQSITCYAAKPPVAHNEVFKEVPKTIPVYVPAGSIDKYKAASKWEDFGDNIQAIPGTATDIVTSTDSKTQKVFRDGQVQILRDGQIYSVTGTEIR